MSETKPQAGKGVSEITLSFEEAISELENIVNKLDSKDTPIDEAVEIYIRGKELYNHCARVLNNSELKIKEINEKDV